MLSIFSRSMTKILRDTPTWGPARPMPSVPTLASILCPSIVRPSPNSSTGIGSQTVDKMGSSHCTILSGSSLVVVILDLQEDAPVPSECSRIEELYRMAGASKTYDSDATGVEDRTGFFPHVSLLPYYTSGKETLPDFLQGSEPPGAQEVMGGKPVVERVPGIWVGFSPVLRVVEQLDPFRPVVPVAPQELDVVPELVPRVPQVFLAAL